MWTIAHLPGISQCWWCRRTASPGPERPYLPETVFSPLSHPELQKKRVNIRLVQRALDIFSQAEQKLIVEKSFSLWQNILFQMWCVCVQVVMGTCSLLEQNIICFCAVSLTLLILVSLLRHSWIPTGRNTLGRCSCGLLLTRCQNILKPPLLLL